MTPAIPQTSASPPNDQSAVVKASASTVIAPAKADRHSVIMPDPSLIRHPAQKDTPENPGRLHDREDRPGRHEVEPDLVDEIGDQEGNRRALADGKAASGERQPAHLGRGQHQTQGRQHVGRGEQHAQADGLVRLPPLVHAVPDRLHEQHRRDGQGRQQDDGDPPVHALDQEWQHQARGDAAQRHARLLQREDERAVPRRRMPQHRTLIFSLKQAGVPLGGVAAGLVLPFLVERMDWRIAVVLLATLPIATVLLVRPVDRVDEGREPNQPSACACCFPRPTCCRP